MGRGLRAYRLELDQLYGRYSLLLHHEQNSSNRLVEIGSHVTMACNVELTTRHKKKRPIKKDKDLSTNVQGREKSVGYTWRSQRWLVTGTVEKVLSTDDTRGVGGIKSFWQEQRQVLAAIVQNLRSGDEFELSLGGLGSKSLRS